MDHQFNTSKSSKTVVNFTLLFFWISFPLLTYALLVSLFAVVSGRALDRAFPILLTSLFGFFGVITFPLQLVNQYNRIRVSKDGLYVEVYAFRYVWKFVAWKNVLDLKLVPALDRWGEPQWLIQVKDLTYWHKWVSLQHSCGSNPGILVNSDLVNREKLLEIVEKNLDKVS